MAAPTASIGRTPLCGMSNQEGVCNGPDQRL